MSNANSSQKFIGRNRAPRVQIEYDVEVYGSEKKVELPFVMGVLADLSGKPTEALPPVADRKFLDIDIDKLNVNGGGIALGHPFGATGARLTTTLLHSLQERDLQFGLETMCIGGGQGMAIIFERLN